MAKSKKIDLNKVLPDATAKLYKVINTLGYVKAIYPGFGMVDFRILSVKQAVQLVGRGFPYLMEKPTKQEEPKKEKKAE